MSNQDCFETIVLLPDWIEEVNKRKLKRQLLKYSTAIQPISRTYYSDEQIPNAMSMAMLIASLESTYQSATIQQRDIETAWEDLQKLFHNVEPTNDILFDYQSNTNSACTGIGSPSPSLTAQSSECEASEEHNPMGASNMLTAECVSKIIIQCAERCSSRKIEQTLSRLNINVIETVSADVLARRLKKKPINYDLTSKMKAAKIALFQGTETQPTMERMGSCVLYDRLKNSISNRGRDALKIRRSSTQYSSECLLSINEVSKMDQTKPQSGQASANGIGGLLSPVSVINIVQPQLENTDDVSSIISLQFMPVDVIETKEVQYSRNTTALASLPELPTPDTFISELKLPQTIQRDRKTLPPTIENVVATLDPQKDDIREEVVAPGPIIDSIAARGELLVERHQRAEDHASMKIRHQRDQMGTKLFNTASLASSRILHCFKSNQSKFQRAEVNSASLGWNPVQNVEGLMSSTLERLCSIDEKLNEKHHCDIAEFVLKEKQQKASVVSIATESEIHRSGRVEGQQMRRDRSPTDSTTNIINDPSGTAFGLDEFIALQTNSLGEDTASCRVQQQNETKLESAAERCQQSAYISPVELFVMVEAHEVKIYERALSVAQDMYQKATGLSLPKRFFERASCSLDLKKLHPNSTALKYMKEFKEVLESIQHCGIRQAMNFFSFDLDLRSYLFSGVERIEIQPHPAINIITTEAVKARTNNSMMVIVVPQNREVFAEEIMSSLSANGLSIADWSHLEDVSSKLEDLRHLVHSGIVEGLLVSVVPEYFPWSDFKVIIDVACVGGFIESLIKRSGVHLRHIKIFSVIPEEYRKTHATEETISERKVDSQQILCSQKAFVKENLLMALESNNQKSFQLVEAAEERMKGVDIMLSERSAIVFGDEKRLTTPQDLASFIRNCVLLSGAFDDILIVIELNNVFEERMQKAISFVFSNLVSFFAKDSECNFSFHYAHNSEHVGTIAHGLITERSQTLATLDMDEDLTNHELFLLQFPSLNYFTVCTLLSQASFGEVIASNPEIMSRRFPRIPQHALKSFYHLLSVDGRVQNSFLHQEPMMTARETQQSSNYQPFRTKRHDSAKGESQLSSYMPQHVNRHGQFEDQNNIGSSSSLQELPDTQIGNHELASRGKGFKQPGNLFYEQHLTQVPTTQYDHSESNKYWSQDQHAVSITEGNASHFRTPYSDRNRDRKRPRMDPKLTYSLPRGRRTGQARLLYNGAPPRTPTSHFALK